MSISHDLIYQNRLEAIRTVQVAQWPKWSGQEVPPDVLEVVWTVMRDVTCGLARTMSCGQTRGRIGGHVGEGPYTMHMATFISPSF